MTSVDKVKQRIAELAENNRELREQLYLTRDTMAQVQREREQWQRESDHAQHELAAVRDELERERKHSAMRIREREELIRQLDKVRHGLKLELDSVLRRNEELRKRVDAAEEHTLVATERLREIEAERDEAQESLRLAEDSFIEIRDHLAAKLGSDEIPMAGAA